MNNIIAKRVLRHAIDLAAAVLKVPHLALKMFRLADELSGLNGKAIPTELIPLNAIQLARGLLNYTALQSLPGWVFPYWAERQFDPSDPAFIPRSHLGLSINITGRNWTAVGSPACPVEPVVDPRGAVMAFRNRWSLDVWVKSAEGVFFPSRHPGVHQQLLDGLPLVQTRFECGGLRVEEITYVDTTTLSMDVSVENASGTPQEFLLAFAIRPFNPEGVAPIHKIRYDPQEQSFLIDTHELIRLEKPPRKVFCSNRTEGDSAGAFAGGLPNPDQLAVSCDAGLANACAAYAVSLGAGEKASFSAAVPLAKNDPPGARPPTKADRVAEEWVAILSDGAEIVTPDERVNLVLRSALCTLLLLTDGEEITPGPWTYHQFWFRDAAYMLRALDTFGFHDRAGDVIRSFPSRQDRKGYFRSQQGEWDSNGQALWTIWQHTLLTSDAGVAEELFRAMQKGVDWIAGKRLTGSRSAGQPFVGLMPAGLSAEHLGLCDYYFWDNWWSTAGIQAFIRVARQLGKNSEAERTESLLEEYRACIRRAIQCVQEKRGVNEIPAGPLRGIDSGMIGSCVAWYPLQELPPGDKAMLKTLCTLNERFVQKGLFFQDFIHSGGNPYLSLQLALGWLYAGRRMEFWRVVSQVLDVATPTLNYPEAIHPRTGGGVMGDGHHGWAAAEIAMALRNALVEEHWSPGDAVPDLVLLGGIPAEWSAPGKRLNANRLSVPGGVMSLELANSTHGSVLDIAFLQKGASCAGNWTVMLPGTATSVAVDGISVSPCIIENGETTIRLKAKAGRTRVVFALTPL